MPDTLTLTPMKKNLKNFWLILKQTYKGWNADDPFRQSAVIAYYAIFSLPALLVLIINAIGFFYEKEAISGEISKQIGDVMGSGTSEMVESMIEKANEGKKGIVSSIIAIVTIIFGATGVFIQFQKSLNQIWDVKEKPDLGFMKQLKTRFFSLGLILSVGFLLLISLVVSTALSALSSRFDGNYSAFGAVLLVVAEFLISLGVITVLFALMFKLLPDVKTKWRTVWLGALLTGLLFMIGKYGLSLYFGKAEPGDDYGAAGSIILILLWVSYSSMIVFFGAEFTKQYAVTKGYHVVPNKDAIKIEDEPGNEKTSEEKEHDQAKVNEHKKESPTNWDTKNSHQTESEKNENVNDKAAIKSVQDLKDEIFRKEVLLKANKEDIKDDFKLKHIFVDLIFKRSWRVSREDQDWNTYTRNLVKKHISVRGEEKGLWTKIKEVLNIQK